MKIRNLIIVAALLTTICSVSRSQNAASGSKLERIVQRSRTHSVTPRDTPPSWMDFDKVRAGGEFIQKHKDFINQILGTSSLAFTYAAKDISPVLMLTGRLPKDFSKRLGETTEYIGLMMQPIKSREEFVSKNLATGYKLGQIHVGVAKQMKALHWNRKERVPINLQSFALVLESFAWWPVEALEATKQIDCAIPDKEIEGWFHFWSVMGYELGVSEELLPTSYAKAKELVALLKKAQYSGAGEPLPDGIPALLGGNVRYVIELTQAQSPGVKPTFEQLLPGVTASFAQVIMLSPGLSDALGLGSDPAATLMRYALLPAPK